MSLAFQSTPDQDAWVKRVLGIDIPAPNGARSTPNGETAKTSIDVDGGAGLGPVAFGKLQLAWREAQARVKADLGGLAKALLNHPGVQADPRFGQVRTVAGGFAGLVPAFGARLEDALNDIINAGRVTEALDSESAAAIAEYRAALGKVPELLKLEAFARAHLGIDLKAHGELDRTLASLGESLANAARNAKVEA